MKHSGIYVESLMHADLERLWQFTQQPDLHQRWDLRFTGIHYLPRPDPSAPQRFLYETRIGFGLRIHGTGESLGQRGTGREATTSALRFSSDDPKSLIRTGSGFWKYVPSADGIRFFTWYDYQVRFGVLGRFADAVAFRPLMGWATAWSFDRLRLWLETGQPPETSLSFFLIHAIARCTVAAIWIWHGLVPKLLFHHADEQIMLLQAGAPAHLVPGLLKLVGVAEVLFGLTLLAAWRSRALLLVSATLMLLATVAVALRSPQYLPAAFNPVTLNLAVIALSLVGWLAAPVVPSAARCLRRSPEPASPSRPA